MFGKKPEQAEVSLLIKVSYVKNFLNLTKKKSSKKVYANLLKELQGELQEYEAVDNQAGLISDAKKIESLLVQKIEEVC